MKNIDELLKNAQLLCNQQRYAELVDVCTEITQSFPDNVEAKHLLSFAYIQLNDMQSALTTLTHVVAVSPKDSVMHNNLANVYKYLKDFDNAIIHYQKAIELAPSYAEAHNNLASILATNDFDKALSHFALAVNAAPDFVLAHFNLGLLFLRKNRLIDAQTQFKNVIALNDEHLGANFYLGVLYLHEGNLTEAEKQFAKVLKIDSEHVEALVNMGVVCLKGDEKQAAVAYFTKALAINNEHEEARNNLAATFLHFDRFENAITHYDVLLKSCPDNVEYLYNAGVAEMALGHLDAARNHFQNILNVDKNHFAALSNLSAVCSRLGEKGEAIALLEQAKVVNPDDKSVTFMLAALKGDVDNQDSCPDYAHHLFENYAINYDEHMLQVLNYNLPQELSKVFDKLLEGSVDCALDLGCGTGLSGEVMRPFSRSLKGVDISEKMIALAQKKGVYDCLVTDEIMSFIACDKESYQLILAADVIPYFGDLEHLFSSIAARLDNGGLFIFSVEASLDNKWSLQETARFHHGIDYVQGILGVCGLIVEYQAKVIGREQEHQPVELIVFAARKT